VTRSELIELLTRRRALRMSQVERAVGSLIDQISEALGRGERVEVRGFGSFKMKFRAARTGRHPQTGNPMTIPARRLPHFKPGKDLTEGVKHHAGPILPASDDD
jgi:integration host factor subunit beta